MTPKIKRTIKEIISSNKNYSDLNQSDLKYQHNIIENLIIDFTYNNINNLVIGYSNPLMEMIKMKQIESRKILYNKTLAQLNLHLNIIKNLITDVD